MRQVSVTLAKLVYFYFNMLKLSLFRKAWYQYEKEYKKEVIVVVFNGQEDFSEAKVMTIDSESMADLSWIFSCNKFRISFSTLFHFTATKYQFWQNIMFENYGWYMSNVFLWISNNQLLVILTTWLEMCDDLPFEVLEIKNHNFLHSRSINPKLFFCL